MTETPTDLTAAPEKPAKKASGGLGGKVLAELQAIAADLGIDGVQGMRKGALIDAIKEARGDAPKAAPAAEAPQSTPDAPVEAQGEAKSEPQQDRAQGRGRRGAQKAQGKPDDAPQDQGKQDQPQKNQPQNDEGQQDQGKQDRAQQDRQQGQRKQQDAKQNEKQDESGSDGESRGNQRNRQQNKGNQQDKNNQQNQPQQNKNNQQGNQNNRPADDDEDDDGTGRRRNRRGRNRSRGMDSEPTYSEDDVLVPAAGILDILDNYAFVRTTGYLPSESDVYVSLSMVRKWGLRRGDAITGQVRQPREGERKEKFNPMVKVETVNGMSLEEAAKRVEFDRLTPVYPTERLRLEGEAGGLTGRLVDLVAPIGKGQRGLVVSPPQAGKTLVLQQIAQAITANNPECHLMVVLVDERPEEVTDFQRTVKGEVISSTFDRPASDHTIVAELAIERAKRLVELGHDVVVLLDGVTRLGRAYNLAAPASGRTLSGVVDSSALYPPKKFFGAARNIEDGGSLTIIATALVETGSRTDEVIFEEFVGTGNWELRLRRDLAEKRLFPAIDVSASSTKRDELLLDANELSIVDTLRRTLAAQSPEQALETVLDRLKKSSTNTEVLLQVNAGS